MAVHRDQQRAEVADAELPQGLRIQVVKVDILDLSRLASEYGRNIHPCKACFSTAVPLALLMLPKSRHGANAGLDE